MADWPMLPECILPTTQQVLQTFYYHHATTTVSQSEIDNRRATFNMGQRSNSNSTTSEHQLQVEVTG